MTRRAAPPSEIAFAADAMLGSLAKWLRLLGYDCTYSPAVTDDGLVAVSRSEGRIVLTRDRRVAKDAARALYVPPGTLDDELVAVCLEFGIDPPEEPPAVRCSLCNARLEAEPRGGAPPPGVPARVVELHLDIWRCPGCKRHYWRGSHIDSMGLRLRRVRERLAAKRAAPGA